ncbi:putative DNA repair protein [Cotonvirus japonicus]|uniref:DNA repair protein n=1 Tax=Cotonvirus japonicus TaxID=2811091 RepID=A0ABM7NT55_9VIRU|nr:putative DNA repair protein [Cotonvirus japonicus]BCS83355.1 putative DNA repair protein [Cotonvirus japonicus]
MSVKSENKKTSKSESKNKSQSETSVSSDKSITYIKLVDDNKTEVNCIYHLSDIHIRNTQRHVEYKEVFNRTYKKIKTDLESKQNINPIESLIVLTGDIVHTKTELSPEVINITYHFFKSLCEITNVILIPGNHDCNLSNKNRMDALSPIIDDIGKLPNLYYLKKSGIYQYYNIVFGVTSVFDDKLVDSSKINKEMWKKIKQKNKYKIALYHGPVHGAKTDVGYRMHNEQLLVEDFNGYDYVLLGDIHKFQYLNEQKTIAYSGSLIQQSYGESLNGHGILKWNILDGNSEHFEIRNDYGFCTVKIVDGKIIDTKIPKKPRIRFILENTNQLQYQEVVNTLEKTYLINEIVKESSFKTKYNHSSPSKTKEKPTAYKTQETIIKSYLEKNNLDKDTIISIIDLHKKIYQKILSDKKDTVNDVMHNAVQNQKWKILELQFSNTLSYGKDNIIDFRKYDPNKIIGIFAPNHYGKSAILDIILFCLFDKCSRGERRDILNKNKNDMYCSILLSVGSQQYFIERIGTRNKNGLTVKIDVNFFSITTDKKGKTKREKLNGLDKNDTNKKISELIGDYNDYLTTCFCLQQGKSSNFIDMTQLQKKEYLNDVLKLNVFENCHNYGKDKLKQMTGQLKLLEQSIGNKSIEDFKEKINSLCSDIKNFSSQKIYIEQELMPDVDFILSNIPHKPKIHYDELSDYKLNTYQEIIDQITEIESLLNKLNINNDFKDIQSDIDEEKNKLLELSKIFNENEINREHDLLELRSVKEGLIKQLVKISKFTNKDDVNDLQDEIAKCLDRIIIIDHVLEEHKNDELTDKMSRIDELKIIIDKFRKSLKIIRDYDNEYIMDLKKNLSIAKSEFDLAIKDLFEVKNILNVEEKNNLSKTVELKKYFINNLVSNQKLLESYELGLSQNNDTIINNVTKKNQQVINKESKWIETTKKSIEFNNTKSLDTDKIRNNYKQLKFKLSDYYMNVINQQHNDSINEKINKAQQELDALSEFSGTKREINNLLQEKNILQEKIKLLESKIKEIKCIECGIESNNIIQLKIDKVQQDIDLIIDSQKNESKKLDQLRSIISNKESILKNHQKQIDKYHKYYNHYVLLNKYLLDYFCWSQRNDMIIKWSKQKNDLTNKLHLMTEELNKKQVELDFYKKEIEQYINSRKEFDDKSAQVNIYQHYVQIMNCNGLPYEILKTYLPLIESDVNEILHSMVSFSIEFMFYDENKIEDQKSKQMKSTMGSVNVNICYEGMKPYSVQLVSGFERFIIGLAIRMTLCQISLTAKPNFLIIDEGWSCLDSENLNNVGTIMNYIKTQYEHVIIISHLEELKNQADYIINIDKRDGHSYIQDQHKITGKKYHGKKQMKVVEL